MPLKIVDLTSSGEGVARQDGKAIFIDGALPGETVEVEIIQSKKRFSKARLSTILEPSSDRVKPICPLFGTCGGCQIMHLAYPAQLKWKTSRVENALQRIAKIDSPVLPTIASPEKLYYRHKIQLHNGGFYKRHTHQTIPISKCYIHNQSGDAELSQVKTCREATIRTSSTTNETLLICDGKPNKTHITEKLSGLTFNIGPHDFFQINPRQASQLYEKALSLANLTPKSRTLDAYCGVGTLTLLAAQKSQEVIGVESGRTAIKNARKNAQLNNITNATFYCDLVENKIASLGTFDTIFLNPPRSGTDPQVLQAILENPPQTLIYISCDPATLARDLTTLNPLFTIDHIQPFDLFPQTTHVETLVCLKREAATR